MYEIYGRSSSEEPLTSSQFMAEVVHPEDADAFAQAIVLPLTTGEPLHFEGQFRHTDGVYRWIEFWGRLQPTVLGKPTQVVGTATDITERRRAEEALRLRQAEIETLNAQLRRAMTETHHRVKNNLQLISALIEMQQASGDNGAIAELARAKQNILALGVIHDILTKEARAGAEFLSVKAVLEQLLPLLQTTIGERRLSIQMDEVPLPAKQTTSLALVTNELVSNAVKHGKGDIEITLQLEEDRARLEVCDGGPGFVAGFDPEEAAHIGLELIESIVRYDLRGEISYMNRQAGGARILILFPVRNLPFL